jgi:hypothetical protein
VSTTRFFGRLLVALSRQHGVLSLSPAFLSQVPLDAEPVVVMDPETDALLVYPSLVENLEGCILENTNDRAETHPPSQGTQ